MQSQAIANELVGVGAKVFAKGRKGLTKLSVEVEKLPLPESCWAVFAPGGPTVVAGGPTGWFGPAGPTGETGGPTAESGPTGPVAVRPISRDRAQFVSAELTKFVDSRRFLR